MEVVANQLVLLIVSIFASILTFVCLALIFFQSKKSITQNKNLKALSGHLKNEQQQVTILRSEVAELRSGIMSLKQHIQQVEQHVQDVSHQQAAQKYDDPDAKIYSRAVKMVELGADIEEVMRECELPRAEAELLMSLHNKAK